MTANDATQRNAMIFFCKTVASLRPMEFIDVLRMLPPCARSGLRLYHHMYGAVLHAVSHSRLHPLVLAGEA